MIDTDSSGQTNGLGLPSPDDPPAVVTELAGACIRFVERGVGVQLDYAAETLPVLDHYLRVSRADLQARPEAIGLVARAVGAYFGEVVRRRVSCWWHLPEDDPATWEIQTEPVFLAFNPIAVAYDAITLGLDGGPTSHLEVEDGDREAIELRLSELPQVDEDEFYSLATRLEVIEIAVDAIKARMVQDGLGDVGFSPSDYDD